DGKVLSQALAHGGALTGVSFHPNGTQLLTSGGDGMVKVWALPPVPSRSLVHPDSVLTAVLTADGKRLITGGKDKIVRAWNTTNNQMERQYSGHTGPVSAVAVSPNGQVLASAAEAGSTSFWYQTNRT